VGLDIGSVTKARWVREDSGSDDQKSNEWLVHPPHPNEYDRQDGLKPGVYEVEGYASFRAGSYSGYNDWRAQLCYAVHRVAPDTLWRNEAAWEGKPFVELICFSDCEGVMGPKTCAKLAADFEKCRDEVTAWARKQARHHRALNVDVTYFLERYELWAKAFRRAAREGFVDFH